MALTKRSRKYPRPIAKRGAKPRAKGGVESVRRLPRSLDGARAKTVKIVGDIVYFDTSSDWEANR